MSSSLYRGCLFGALVGDCTGAFYECMFFQREVPIEPLVDHILMRTVTNPEITKEKHSDDLTKSPSPKNRPPWRYTDDTVLTWAIARSLIRRKSFDAADMAKSYTDAFFAAPRRGFGAAIGDVFAALRDSEFAAPYAPAARQFGGSGSFGNGGAMRAAPLALYGANLGDKEFFDLVCNATRLTHTHKLAVHYTLLQSWAVREALRNHRQNRLTEEGAEATEAAGAGPAGPAEAGLAEAGPADSETGRPAEVLLPRLEALVQRAQAERWCWGVGDEEEKDAAGERKDGANGGVGDDEVTKEVESAARQCDWAEVQESLRLVRELLAADDCKTADVIDRLGHDVSAQHSVPTAIFAFLYAFDRDIKGFEEMDRFSRVIAYAISLGGDTDTIASMSGAICGAWMGAGAMPNALVGACESHEEAAEMAEGLSRLVRGDDELGKHVQDCNTMVAEPSNADQTTNR